MRELKELTLSENCLTIAVDGPAASGKGTLSRRLARHFGLTYLDTGSLYRAAALKALDNDVALDDEAAVSALAETFEAELLDDPRLRERGVGEAASRIAGLTEVRNALLTFQRKIAYSAPGAVLDGRDIGTVVCPDAQVKLFVTASVEERARRRHKEMAEKDPSVTLTDIKADILRRDARDSSRDAAPLLQAADAHLLDTTNLDIETAMNAAVSLINSVLAERR